MSGAYTIKSTNSLSWETSTNVLQTRKGCA